MSVIVHGAGISSVKLTLLSAVCTLWNNYSRLVFTNREIAILPRSVSQVSFPAVLVAAGFFSRNLDKLVLLAAIATMSMAEARHIDASYDEMKSGEKRIKPQHTNFLSLSEFTNIPRETVRRKTEDLIAKGWVVRSEIGLFVSQSAAGELEDLSVMAFDLLMHIHGIISKGLASARKKPKRKK